MANSLAAQKVQELIRSSRDRCRAQYGLVPTAGHPALRLQQSEVDKRRERFLDLIGGFGPELDRASIIPDKGRYCLLITDCEGIVVEAYIPDADAIDFARFGITLGGVWDERVAGTNGIDMALRADCVLTVQGKDHFHQCYRAFSCSSAPLHDAGNNLIGSVTLVGSARHRPDETACVEQVVRITGSRFQAQIFRKFHADKITARLVSHNLDTLKRFETMVACDENGMIVSSIPLWRDGAAPDAHRELEGRHLSDVRDMTVSMRGPAMVLPRRMVSVSNRARMAAPLRVRPDAALASLAEQGGGLEVIVDRARKLAANRVPLLICGEHGVDKEGLARALIHDVMPTYVAANVLDAAHGIPAQEFAETLKQIRFLSEYPIGKLPPVLVLLNADRLGADLQSPMKDFLQAVERATQGLHQIAVRPLLIFSVERAWQDLREGGDMDPALLYLMGQAIVEVPPIRDRDLSKVLDSLLKEEFENRLDLSEPARRALLDYDWPGNLRELRAVLREAAICGNGRRINHADLPQRLREQTATPLAEDRRQVLVDALDSTGWNVTRAAARLGKSRATVNRWILNENLKRPADI